MNIAKAQSVKEFEAKRQEELRAKTAEKSEIDSLKSTLAELQRQLQQKNSPNMVSATTGAKKGEPQELSRRLRPLIFCR